MQLVDAVGISPEISPSVYRGPSKLLSRYQGVSPSPEHVRVVQSTWLKVLPNKEATAELFYDTLFEMDPSLRRMFRGDMREQCDELIRVIDAAVKGLSRLERVVPAVEELGRSHASYGVKDDHYGAVGAALIWALAKSLRVEFTPDVKDAWATVYGVLATAMREAAASARA